VQGGSLNQQGVSIVSKGGQKGQQGSENPGNFANDPKSLAALGAKAGKISLASVPTKSPLCGPFSCSSDFRVARMGNL
jgi:hypothetical protein